MNRDELKEILRKHTLWLIGEDGGEHANLRGVDLRGANLRDADLTGVDLTDANLRGVDLTGANLRGANLRDADLRGVDLTGVDLTGANLLGADLTGADLTGVDLTGADLRDADLRDAKLSGVDLSEIKFNEYTCGLTLVCPEEGAFIGYKKAQEKIVVLEIPADAKRSSATTVKCRCSKAKVLRIENLDGTLADVDSVHSDYDKNFVYKVGKIVEVRDFDDNRWNECSAGIHFFVAKELARVYDN